MASMATRVALGAAAPKLTAAPASIHRAGPSSLASAPPQQRQSLSVAMRAVPPIQTNAAELAMDASSSLPTPVVPCGPMMADFLLAYRRVLQTASVSGDSAAAAGASVLSCIRSGLAEIRGMPQQWRKENGGLEQLLWELEQDIVRLEGFKEKKPAALAVQLAALRCTEAARMLRRLARQ